MWSGSDIHKKIAKMMPVSPAKNNLYRQSNVEEPE